MRSFSLCLRLSVLNDTPGGLMLVVVTHCVILSSLSFALPAFQTGEGDAASPPLMTSCFAHARSHPSVYILIDPHASGFLSPSLYNPPKKHLCSSVSAWRLSILTQQSFFVLLLEQNKAKLQ